MNEWVDCPYAAFLWASCGIGTKPLTVYSVEPIG